MVAYVPPKQAGKYKAVASGAITNGKPVFVHTDGTVKQVSQTVDAADAGHAAGGQFESATGSGALYSSVVFDSVNNKVAVAYQDIGNSNKITVAVGTTNSSNGAITWGTPVLAYNASPTYFDITYAGSGKIVVAFQDTSAGGGAARVGTISGNSVSFGTQSSDFTGNGNTIQGVRADYDSNADRVVLAYKDAGDGDDGIAVVGTVSSTSISFGSTVKFASSGTGFWELDFDSNSNKMVIAYSDGGNSYFGTCKVGTVSGTSISFGTAVVFESADSRAMDICFDSTNNKMIVVYKDTSNSNYSTGVVGTVSGTGISFGSPVVINTAAAYEYHSVDHDPNSGKHMVVWSLNSGLTNKYAIGTVSGTSVSYASAENLGGTAEVLDVVFDSSSGWFVSVYDNEGSSNTGESITFRIAYSNTTNTLTSENYIGIASGGTYADTAEATIDIVGTVNKDQTSLTAGQTYYVQNDGTLGTSADSPSVVAGTAISATELIVKG